MVISLNAEIVIVKTQYPFLSKNKSKKATT